MELIFLLNFQVYRDCFMKNGRPKVCATNIWFGLTIGLSTYNIWQTVDNEREFRDKMTNYYTTEIMPNITF